MKDDPLKIEGAEGSSITGSTSTAVRPSRSAVEERRSMGLDWKRCVFLVLVYSKTARRHVMAPSEVASAHAPIGHWPPLGHWGPQDALLVSGPFIPPWLIHIRLELAWKDEVISSAVWPSTVRSGEWPAWFSFWFSGRWRAPLAKGTAWAGFYCAILLLLLSHKFRAFRTNSAPTHRAWVGRPRRNQLHAQGARAELLEKNPPGGRQK